MWLELDMYSRPHDGLHLRVPVSLDGWILFCWTAAHHVLAATGKSAGYGTTVLCYTTYFLHQTMENMLQSRLDSNDLPY